MQSASSHGANVRAAITMELLDEKVDPGHETYLYTIAARDVVTSTGCKFLLGAVDKSRVETFGLETGVFALPDNTAFWAPVQDAGSPRPQACRDRRSQQTAGGPHIGARGGGPHMGISFWAKQRNVSSGEKLSPYGALPRPGGLGLWGPAFQIGVSRSSRVCGVGAWRTLQTTSGT